MRFVSAHEDRRCLFLLSCSNISLTGVNIKNACASKLIFGNKTICLALYRSAKSATNRGERRLKLRRVDLITAERGESKVPVSS